MFRYKKFFVIILLSGCFYCCDGGSAVLDLCGLQLTDHYRENLDLWDPTKSIDDLSQKLEDASNLERLEQMVESSKFVLSSLPLGTHNDYAVSYVFALFRTYILLKSFYSSRRDLSEKSSKLAANIAIFKSSIMSATDSRLYYVPEDVDATKFELGGLECAALFDLRKRSDLLAIYRAKSEYSSRFVQWQKYEKAAQRLVEASLLY